MIYVSQPYNRRAIGYIMYVEQEIEEALSLTLSLLLAHFGQQTSPPASCIALSGIMTVTGYQALQLFGSKKALV